LLGGNPVEALATVCRILLQVRITGIRIAKDQWCEKLHIHVRTVSFSVPLNCGRQPKCNFHRIPLSFVVPEPVERTGLDKRERLGPVPHEQISDHNM
jgi:hypothetical protein